VSWTVEVQRPAEKELANLPVQVRKRIAATLRALRDEPFPHRVKKLKGTDGYRIRVGDYRILFRVDRTTQYIWVSAIGHRKDVYR